jgi:muramoyltetrapeptide carboxypeptidase LdcA involved in peptidoglycan recycling
MEVDQELNDFNHAGIFSSIDGIIFCNLAELAASHI